MDKQTRVETHSDGTVVVISDQQAIGLTVVIDGASKVNSVPVDLETQRIVLAKSGKSFTLRKRADKQETE